MPDHRPKPNYKGKEKVEPTRPHLIPHARVHVKNTMPIAFSSFSQSSPYQSSHLLSPKAFWVNAVSGVFAQACSHEDFDLSWCQCSLNPDSKTEKRSRTITQYLCAHMCTAICVTKHHS